MSLVWLGRDHNFSDALYYSMIIKIDAIDDSTEEVEKVFSTTMQKIAYILSKQMLKLSDPFYSALGIITDVS